MWIKLGQQEKEEKAETGPEAFQLTPCSALREANEVDQNVPVLREQAVTLHTTTQASLVALEARLYKTCRHVSA